MDINCESGSLAMKNRKLIRILELFLILAIAFAPKIFSSIFILLTGYEYHLVPDAKYAQLLWVSKSATDLAAISVLVYVLFQRGRSLKHIGFNFSKRDFPISIILVLVSYIAHALA